ncbi:MAG: polymer-forming cytoskeletal protein [Myxococcales bacterium]|nr:polymer-forming cytoskeletal protein [Myxococcales bacterium]
MFGSKSADPTVIGRGAVVEGNIWAKGRVQVDGEINGSLNVDGQLSIGPEGRVNGEVIADDVAVGGEVEGRVTARRLLHVVASGKIRGEVCYESLQIDRGAVLDGRTAQGDSQEAEEEVPADVETAAAPAG